MSSILSNLTKFYFQSIFNYIYKCDMSFSIIFIPTNDDSISICFSFRFSFNFRMNKNKNPILLSYLWPIFIT